ncbi:heparanase [Thalassophryne amazonica]|uniref:heparanase n=1 Tax=Thalassophryne amazonica TaxID=390379 RepID=UPI001470C188|nr:heparanase [Thalassophryne amazonica]
MNLAPDPVQIFLPVCLSFNAVEAFVLQSKQPGRAGLCSRSVNLNGKLLKMMDDQTLPSLEGSSLPPADHLQLPSYSLALYVLKDAAALAYQ